MPKTRKATKGDRPISRFVNLSEAARRLGRNSEYLKGHATGLGIELERCGKSLVMSADEFDRLKKAVEKDRHPIPAGA